MAVIGKIHSLESFGAADGPGVRFIVFLKGCNMRCSYCHNPDSWASDGSEEYSAQELIKKILRYRGYWGEEGGLTVSGGEPLLQIDFVTELFKAAHDEGINTVLDTSGNPFSKDTDFIAKFDELMKYTDLVILDIKEMDPVKHKELTGQNNSNILEMAEYLSETGKAMWIRHVLVPGITDSDEDLTELSQFIDKLKTVKRVEVLPYHTLGVFKWENLGMKYKLEGVPSPDADCIAKANRILKTDKYK